MKFAQPIWLLMTLVVVPMLVWVFYHFDRSRREMLKRFASEHLLGVLTASVSPLRRSLKRWLTIAGVGLCFLALAQPQFGFHWEEVRRNGIDILFAVDTSRSMLAQDVNPDRLTRARMAVMDLMAKLQGDRVGLIAFAGTSFLQCPLTLDYDAFRQSLDALDTHLIPKGGTNLASAIQEAEKAYSLGGMHHKILILLTDGEDLEASGIAAARDAAQHGVKIFPVGVGTATGELIPIRNQAGGAEFLKDENGQAVKSRLDENTLRQIAGATGGLYQPLGQQGQGLEAIYEQGLAAIPKKALSSRMTQVYINRFQWPLALGILCLMIEWLLGERRTANKFQVFKKTAVVSPTICLLFILYPLPVRASPQSAEKAYHDGKFQEATDQFKVAVEKNPKKAKLQFNLGASAYKNGQYDDAAGAFQKALQTDQPALQQQTFYNLGNTQYRLGQKTEKETPQQTIHVWQQALQYYQHALQLETDDADARFNYEFVKKKLEELQKQQPEEKKEAPKDEQKQDDSKQNEPQESSGQKESAQDQKDAKNEQKQDGMNQEKTREQQEKDQAASAAEKRRKDEEDGDKEPQPLPGQMNKEEARNLLDSLKADERKMPIVLDPTNKGIGVEDTPKRDW